MFVTGIAVMIQARKRPEGDVMPVDTKVLGADMRTFVIAYGIAIAAALFLPSDPTWPKIVVAILLLVVYGWYVKGHFEADPSVDIEDLAPLRFHRFDAGRTDHRRMARRASGSSTSRSWRRSGLIIVGAVAFVDAVEHVASTPRRQPGAPGARRSRRSRPSCRRSSTRSSGSARARTPSRWATSPGRWSSSRRSRCPSR